MGDIEISLVKIVGSPYYVSSEDGQKVYSLIENALKSEEHVSLSFAHVEGLTSAFLNVAIGQLYENFSEEIIRQHLSVSEISSNDKVLFNLSCYLNR